MRAVLVALLFCMCGAPVWSEEPYWNMQTCDFCKTYNDQPGLLEHCRFEYHQTANGMLAVIYVDSAYWPKFTSMQVAQGAAHNRLMAGEAVTMCTHCSTINELFKAGTKIEPIRSADAFLTLFSASDSAVIAKIHAHAERCNEQNARDMAAAGQ